uniref:LON peptidase N-terminal domain and ring finger 2 n=1 Tax=Capra hircus TaxID=9925 RepID=A0A452EUL3_CAPHI
MKNYEQALQDAGEVCQNEPLLSKGHHVKAQALSGLGRSKETWREFLCCLALHLECNSVKKAAQKVLCEVFFPASEYMPQSLTSSKKKKKKEFNIFYPKYTVERETEGSNPSEKPDVFRNSSSSVLRFILGLHCEEDQEVLDGILPTEPSTGLKRQFPNDSEDARAVSAPGKIPRKEADSLPQTNVNCNTGESEELPIEVADFECALCMRLFFEPVTTPCGHMFCLKCLERCLDHVPHCPLCRSKYFSSRKFNKTTLAEELIFRYFSDALSDRESLTFLLPHSLTRDVPIFVCTMAFPTVPCLLHIFEPRYRLMIRRCLETGPKRSGMCLSAEHAGISEYGCMLAVKDVRTFPDGGSIIDAVGISRFWVLSHRHRDGYNRLSLFLDQVEGPECEELVMLRDSVYQQSVSWFASLQDPMKEQISSHCGSVPDREPEPQSNPGGPAWSWWMLAVLPLAQKAQLATLGVISLKEHLLAIRRILVIITRKRNSQQEHVNSRERSN